MPHTPPAELLLRQRLSALGRGLAGARAGEVTGVHQARVATRRLREALPLLVPGKKGRKLERTIRKLTRVLGPVRELDVALEMLAEFDQPADAPHDGIACLRDVIREERESLQSDAAHEMERYDVAKMRKKALGALAAIVGAAEEEGTPTAKHTRAEGRRAAAQRAGHRAGRLRAAVENAAGIYLPDRLHEVRIEVKKLRYALEVAQQVSAPRAASAKAAGKADADGIGTTKTGTAKTGTAKAAAKGSAGKTLRSVSGQIATLKDAQELLGRMHDLEILISRARAVQGTARAADLRISAGLDRLVRLWETECRQLHGRYMTQRRRLLTIVERTTAAAARATRRTTAA